MIQHESRPNNRQARRLALAWGLCILVGLVLACGGDPPPGELQGVQGFYDASPPTRAASADVIGHTSRPWTGDLDGMKERRLVRALVAYNRTYYFLDGPRERGINSDALRAFEEHLNKKLGGGVVKLNLVIVPVTRDKLFPYLLEGRGDLVAANLTVTDLRRQRVDFATPIMRNVTELVVTGPTAPPIASLDDLSGKEVWVRKTSSYRESLDALNEKLVAEGKEPVVLRDADERLETEDILEMVAAGLLPITVADKHLADFWGDVFDGLTVHQDLAVRTGGSVAWAFRKDSPLLAAELNEFMRANSQGTLLGNILLKRYLKTNPWVKNAATQESLRRLGQMVELFRKYSDQYDFDWLMMAAQGYQESGLDQSKISPAGAIGVMQLLKTTAADRSVGIPEIEKLENNIHAGIKYMRFILDTYFADANLGDVDKHLFAFAAYNAGPNRIRTLRQKAAAQGLDPDVWFQNVELVVAKEVGREPVQYVSNIYKYYLAYRLVQEQGLLGRAQQKTATPAS